jgi:hypothetical protein
VGTLKNSIFRDERTQFTSHEIHYVFATEPSRLMRWLWRMPSSWMWRRVAPVRTDDSEERSACIIMVTIIVELGKTLAVTYNLISVLRLLVTAVVPNSPIIVTLMMEAIHYPETSVLTRPTRSNIPEDGSLKISRNIMINFVLILQHSASQLSLWGNCYYWLCTSKMFMYMKTQRSNTRDGGIIMLWWNFWTLHNI